MKYLTILFILISFNCHADNYLTLTLASKHFKDDNYNESNPGIGLNINHYLVGQYKNSYDKNSVYAGYEFEKKLHKNYSVGVKAGGVTGYTDEQVQTFNIIGDVKFFAVPQVTIKQNGVNYIVGVIPGSEGAVTFQLDLKF